VGKQSTHVVKDIREGKHTTLTQGWIDKLTELDFVWCAVFSWCHLNSATKAATGGSTPVLSSVAAAGSDGDSDISTETEKDNHDPRSTLSPLHKDNKSLCGDVTVEPNPGNRKADNISEMDTSSLSYKKGKSQCANVEVDGGSGSRKCDIESNI